VITNETALQELITSVLADAGFRKRRSTWFRTRDDTIQVVDLQKSQWGGQYYLNVGVYVRSLGRATVPKEHECHLRTRLTSLDAQHREKIDAALDLERVDLPGDERRDILATALREVALPFLDQHSTVPQLRQSYRAGLFEPFFITAPARDVLGREDTFGSG
jgi:hypothetical protein